MLASVARTASAETPPGAEADEGWADHHPLFHFDPGPPEPVPEPPPEPTEDFRAATARFVGAQSDLARSLVSRTTERGRAFAATISERAAALRPRPAATEPAPGDEAGPSRGVPGRLREGARGATGYARGRIADTVSRLREVTRDRNTLGDAISRPAVTLGLGAVALVALLAILTGRSGNEEEPAPAETRSQAQAQPPAATAPGAPAAPRPLGRPPSSPG